MPTITYNIPELKKLVGKKMSNEQLAEVITLIKPNLEKIEGGKITIEHTADRPDLFSSEGLARSISNYLGFGKGLTKYKVGKPKIELTTKNVAIRPYVSAAVFRGLKMSEEFFENMINVQEILADSIGRKRRKVAIGIHDFDKIKGPINYWGAARDETMTPLGSSEKMKLSDVLQRTEKGTDYGGVISSSKTFPVFSDSIGIFSLPPIINSERTSVTQKTKNLFVEVTGTNKNSVAQVMNILASGLAERSALEGVKIKFEKKSEITPNLSETVTELEAGLVNRMLGLKLSSKDIIDLLGRMGYDALSGGPDKIEVIVPSFRNDILHPVDIVEDVAIAYGYNNLKSDVPNISTIGRSLNLEKLCDGAALSLVGFGFQEVFSSCLSNKSDQFAKMGMPETEIVEIENPSSADYTCVRNSLLPGLLKILSVNKHVEYPQNIFETGDVVMPDNTEETLARNERRIAGTICHSKAGFAEMKSVLDSMMKNLGLGYKMEECDSGMYIPGRGVDVYVEKKFVGSFGELHPAVTQNWDIGMPVAVFEISLESV